MKKIEEITKKIEKEIEPEFKKIEKICEKNSIKVIKAFQECNLQEMHLQTSTGYGIDEPGRNKIEEIYNYLISNIENNGNKELLTDIGKLVNERRKI